MMTTQKPTTRSEHAQDKVVEDTFPASDPPANSGVTGAEVARHSTRTGAGQDEPTGSPTSDRHATETAHHSEPDVKPPTHKDS